MKTLLITILIPILLIGTNVSGQTKSVVLNEKLMENGSVSLYFSSISVTGNHYKLKFHFTTQSFYYDTKIDNIYVGDYVPVQIVGLTLGHLFNGANGKEFTVTVPREHKQLHIRGFGVYDYYPQNMDIDLSKYDHLIPQTEKTPVSEAPQDTSKPSLTIASPQLHQNVFRTEEFALLIRGTAHDTEGLAFVTVNGSPASLRNDGTFQKRIKLKIGTNTVSVTATDINDNDAETTFTVIREEYLVEDEFSDLDFALETNNR